MLDKLRNIIEKALENKLWNVKDNLIDYVKEYLSKYHYEGVEFLPPSVFEDRDMFILKGNLVGNISKQELDTDFHNYLVKIKSYKDIGKVNINIEDNIVTIEVIYNNLLSKINNYKLTYVHNYTKEG